MGFAVPAKDPGLAYRKLAEGFKPNEVFYFKYERAVGSDFNKR